MVFLDKVLWGNGLRKMQTRTQNFFLAKTQICCVCVCVCMHVHAHVFRPVPACMLSSVWVYKIYMTKCTFHFIGCSSLWYGLCAARFDLEWWYRPFDCTCTPKYLWGNTTNCQTSTATTSWQSLWSWDFSKCVPCTTNVIMKTSNFDEMGYQTKRSLFECVHIKRILQSSFAKF